jgi:hypothetical protein
MQSSEETNALLKRIIQKNPSKSLVHLASTAAAQSIVQFDSQSNGGTNNSIRVI